MITTFRFNHQNKQLYVTTKDGKLYYIPLKNFAKYIPFPWDGNTDIFNYPSLKGLFIDILDEIWMDSRELFDLKLFTIHYSYRGEPKKVSYNSWSDARRQYLKIIKNRDIYSNIFPDFNAELVQ